ncbi:MAG TPA: c-type cytochrome [Gaiellaceae bacterium]|nr:c-type cytochrome [Gaiellaceae bacterium]
MRTAAAALLGAMLLAGCGGGDGNGNDTGAAENGAHEAGRQVFTAEADPACASCHTLADAGATGTAAPNLDELQPSAEQVEEAVRTGPGIMPAYEGELSEQQIEDVAAYVADAAGG